METASVDQGGDPSPPGAPDTEAPAAEEARAPSPAPGPFPTRSPADGSLLPGVDATDPAALPAMLERARKAQAEWARVAPAERAAKILGVKRRLLGRAEEIADLLHRECGKPVEEALLAEVLPNADLVDYWTSSIDELLDGPVVELDALAYPGKLGQDPPRSARRRRADHAVELPGRDPAAHARARARSRATRCVFKPSEITPRAGALVASLFDGLLPEGVLQVVQGGGDVGAALVRAGVDLVVFTGSVATGRKIAVACAERLIPCSLELGGKDAAIVLRDCKLERTARGLVWGAFTNAGQNCASIERVYVERAVADKLIPRVVELDEGAAPGRGHGRAHHGAAARHRPEPRSRRRSRRAPRCSRAALPAGDGLAFPPTVVKVTNEDTPLMRDETFGPILPIVVVEDEDEAMRRANASRFGLTTSVWTRRVNHAHALARRLRAAS